ncbi:uncharacterized protein METZ01_LOCUS270463 [marine metagenome]|uniref:Uncharacterized protein n=1 Tax=marine metagenome TaxID=408172 RepID=A0A382K0J4_9ZZZZ
MAVEETPDLIQRKWLILVPQKDADMV